MPPRAIKALEKDIGELDGEYNLMSDILAHGEQEDFSRESHDYIDHIHLKFLTWMTCPLDCMIGIWQSCCERV